MCYDVYLISISYPSIAYPYHIKTQSHINTHNYPAAQSSYRHHHPIYPSLSPSSHPPISPHSISPNSPPPPPSTVTYTHTRHVARVSPPIPNPSPQRQVPRRKSLSPPILAPVHLASRPPRETSIRNGQLSQVKYSRDVRVRSVPVVPLLPGRFLEGRIGTRRGDDRFASIEGGEMGVMRWLGIRQDGMK
jgi:hypothetical protein